MSRSKRIAEQLGMPHGTATNRLRKIIIFDLLKQLGKNICFKCYKEIIKVEELSVEHKLPWEGRSVELFWDLQNIAFSHRACNRPHVNRGGYIAADICGTYAKWYSGCRCEPCCVSMREYKKDYRSRTGIH